MNCNNEASAASEVNIDCLPPKTNPVRIPPMPPRINEAMSLEVAICLSWITSPAGANDLVRSKVKKAPAKVRIREAKKRDKA